MKGARILIKTKMARPKHLINNRAFYVPALSKDIHAVRADEEVHSYGRTE